MTDLAAAIVRNTSGDGLHDTAITGMRCIRFSSPGDSMPTIYQPSVCVIAQGSKEVQVDGELLRYQPSQYLAISVDLPVVGQVTTATATDPYLCLQLDLDPGEITDLMARMEHRPTIGQTYRGIFVARVDEGLLESVLRLVRLLDNPKDIPLLGPLAKREVYYRLLTGEHGAAIAHIGSPAGNMERILRVLHFLRSDFTRNVRIEDLADMAGMSLSSFHHHFRQVTAMSPLQYQKRLRLTEARRILMTGEADASSTAYRVGYESPSQFSREYARMYGAPPVRHVSMLRGRDASSLTVA